MTDLKSSLDHLLKLSEAATPGPWKIGDEDWSMIHPHYDSVGEDHEPISNEINRKVDAEFIAAARTSLPALVKAVQVAVETLKVYEDREYESRTDSDGQLQFAAEEALAEITALLVGGE